MQETSSAQFVSEEDFFSTYLPVKNHIDPNATFGGFLFETFGEEFEYVRSRDIYCIFTYLEDDNGKPCIVSGFHLVNRLGYFVTQNPCDTDVFVQLEAVEEITPGLYVYSLEKFDTVEEAVSSRCATFIDLPYRPVTLQDLADVMVSYEKVVNAVASEPWRLSYYDENFQLQASDVLKLEHDESVLLTNSLSEVFSDCPDNTAKFVTTIAVVDPDTSQSVDISVYKDHESSGMFAVDDAYLITLSDEDPVHNPFNGRHIFLQDAS